MVEAPPPPQGHSDVSWRLFAVYVLFALTSVLGTLLLAVLILLLRRFDVFHIHFRTILWNLLACILLNNQLQLLRPLVLFVQHFSAASIDERQLFNEADRPEAACLELNPLPAAFCGFLSISGIVLAIERLYATLNFAQYENENFTRFLDYFFKFMWTAFGVNVLWNVAAFSPHHFDYLECTLRQIEKNPIKTHWHILFAVVFQAVFLLIFAIVVTVNREKQTVYVKHFYNSLSPRFQIGENIKATRLLVSITAALFLSFGAILLHRLWEYWRFARSEESWEAAMFWEELSLLIMPLCTTLMPTIIFCRSAVFLSKGRVIVKDALHSRLLGQAVPEAKSAIQ
ncbi:Serpentine receptor class alpha/beta-14 [Aphelenchoides fujianensis]|nr:Serpentine receptor class alpha/beta-14 [Aphelenchoides fujianensis]